MEVVRKIAATACTVLYWVILGATAGHAAEGGFSGYFPGAFGSFLVGVAPQPGMDAGQPDPDLWRECQSRGFGRTDRHASEDLRGLRSAVRRLHGGRPDARRTIPAWRVPACGPCQRRL